MKDYKSRSSTLFLRERKRSPRLPLILALLLVVAGAIFAIMQLQRSPGEEAPPAPPTRSGSEAEIPLPLPPAPVLGPERTGD